VQAIPLNVDSAKSTILCSVKEASSGVLDGVKGVSDAVINVLDGVREEGAYMREATTNMQKLLKEAGEKLPLLVVIRF
jgi:hypothetical protein